MPSAIDGFVPQRLTMVERDLVSRGIRDAAVLSAMRTVPRHLFVTDEHLPEAYDDAALSLLAGQTISQPYIVAVMLERARLEPTHRLLEVGTGSGYAAAVASLMCEAVFTLERLPVLAERAAANLRAYPNVHLRCADGTLGWPAHAPFEAILVAAAGLAIPPALLDQLAPGGRLVMPLEHEGEQRLIRVVRTGQTDFAREDLLSVRFVPLIEGTPTEAG